MADTGPARLGVDIGGTFTDLALWSEGRLTVHKVASTPSQPQLGVIAGAAELVPAGAALDLVHGSTVATNAFLERKGVRTAFLATAGFTDLVALGRQARPALYDLAPVAPPPVLDPRDVHAVAERVAADGRVLRRLTPAAARKLAKAVAATGATSAAITCLFSYLTPEHEMRLAAALEAEGIEAHRSSAVLPRSGEFERASATVLNAYLSPLIRGYLGELVQRLAPRSFAMMKSSGGCFSAEAASRMGLATILSGPAGGVVGALQACEGVSRLITFDMGGTSTDVALVDGAPQLARDYQIEGWPVGIPVLDIRTIGAGGGSIARVDRGGSLRVGPASAGADPGPACYGRGEELTVTDAHVVLGQIPPSRFLGGRQRLVPERAHRAAEALGKKLGMTAEQVAAGVVEVVRSNMQRAIRAVSVARGHDPAEFTLVSFGGAGGLHAFYLAAELGVGQVLVPRYPGALSALGMLGADRVAEAERGLPRPSQGAADLDHLGGVFADLERQNEEELGPGAQAHHRAAGIAYVGRSEELVVPWGAGVGALERAVEAFHREHRRRHGTSDANEPVRVVSAQVRTVRAGEPVRYPRLPASEGREAPVAGRARAWMGAGLEDLPVLERNQMAEGMAFAGPALVMDETATTVVPAGWRVRVDGVGNLLGSRA